jgi:two-component system response regulator
MEQRNFVLMLEDDSDDRFITELTLKRLDIPVAIEFVASSGELLQRLDHGARPVLILLDYNSGPLNAVEILARLKADLKYNRIPVVVLTDTGAQEYVAACYRAGASSVVRKPVSMEDTEKKISSFFQYWLSVVEV